MADSAAQLKALPGQLLDHDYSYESFGSWSTVVRYRGVPIRLLFDGKARQIRLQRSPSRKPPYQWSAASWQRDGSDTDVAVSELLEAIQTVAEAR